MRGCVGCSGERQWPSVAVSLPAVSLDLHCYIYVHTFPPTRPLSSNRTLTEAQVSLILRFGNKLVFARFRPCGVELKKGLLFTEKTLLTCKQKTLQI